MTYEEMQKYEAQFNIPYYGRETYNELFRLYSVYCLDDYLEANDFYRMYDAGCEL